MARELGHNAPTLVPRAVQRRRPRRVRRRSRWYWRWAKRLTIVAVLLGTIVVVLYQRYTDPTLIRQRMLTELEAIVGRNRVTLRDARFSLTEGLAAENISVIGPTDETLGAASGETVLSIARLRVKLDYGATLLNLLHFNATPAFESVEVERPVVRLRVDPSGQLVNPIFEISPSEGGTPPPIPPIAIRDARVEFTYAPIFLEGSLHTIQELNVVASRDPDDPEFLTVRGDAVSPLGRFTIDGRLQLYGEESHFVLSNRRFRLDRQTTRILNPLIQRQWERFAASLDVDVRAYIDIEPNTPVGVRVDLSVLEGGMAFHLFPVPVDSIYGTITLTNYPPPPDMPLKLPPGVDLSQFEREPGTFVPGAPRRPLPSLPRVDPLRSGGIEPDLPPSADRPMTASGLADSVGLGRARGARPDKQALWAQVHLRGEYKGGGVALDADIRRIATPDERVAIVVSIYDLVVDEDFQLALLDAPEVDPGIKQLVRQFEPFGLIDAQFIGGNLYENLSVWMRDVVFTYENFPYPMRRARATVSGFANRWRVFDAWAVTPDGRGEVGLDVTLDPTATPTLTIEVEAVDVTLDRALLDALPSRVTRLLDEFNLQGSIRLPAAGLGAGTRRRLSRLGIAVGVDDAERDAGERPTPGAPATGEPASADEPQPPPGGAPSSTAAGSTAAGSTAGARAAANPDTASDKPASGEPEIDYRIVVMPLAVKFRWDRFPIPVLITDGVLTSTNTMLRISGAHGYHGANTEVWVDGTIAQRGGEQAVDLTLRATRVPITTIRRMLEAPIPAAYAERDGPVRAQLLRLFEMFRPTGSVDIRFTMSSQASPTFSIQLRLRGCGVTYERFPLPIAGLTGTLDVQITGESVHVRMVDLKGRYRDAGIFLRGSFQATGLEPGATPEPTADNDATETGAERSGAAPPTPELMPELMLHLRATNVPLEDPAIQSAFAHFEDTLAPDGHTPDDERLFTLFAPKGRMDATLDILPGPTPGAPPQTLGLLTLRGIEITVTRFPYTLTDLYGTVVVQGTASRFTDLTARHGQARLTLTDGAFDDDGYFIRVFGENLALDRDLYDAVPAGMKALFDAITPTGRFGGAFELRARGRDPLTQTIEYRARVRFADNGFTIGLPIQHARAHVEIAGTITPQSGIRTQGTVRIDEFTVVNTKAQGGLMHFQFANGVLRIPSLEGRYYGGFVTGNFEMTLGDEAARTPGRYHGRVKIRKLDLGRWLREVFPGSRRIAGIGDGDIKFAGTLGTERRLTGSGRFDVLDAELFDVPLVLKLFDFVNFSEATPIDEMRSRFTLSLDGVRFEPLVLLSDAVAMVGTGTMSWDSDMDMVYTIHFGPRLPWPVPLRAVFQVIEENVLRAWVQGPINDLYIAPLIPDARPRRAAVRPAGEPLVPEYRPRTLAGKDRRRPNGQKIPSRPIVPTRPGSLPATPRPKNARHSNQPAAGQIARPPG